MKQLFIAGNWKSNKTIAESAEWVKAIAPLLKDVSLGESTAVVLAPFTALSAMKSEMAAAGVPLALGAQDISPFASGAYTGEVHGGMIAEVATWVIIGHSERRKYFSETDEMLQKKVEQAHAAGLKVIYCVPDDTTPVPGGVEVVAYEPVWAIGTGKTASPENANAVVTSIKAKTQAKTVIYGGSVVADNVHSFVSQAAIDGVLPGGASMDAGKYAALIRAAVS